MIKIEQSAQALAYVEAARKSDDLAELCTLTDYHPDHGKVEQYWKPKYLSFMKEIIRGALDLRFDDPGGDEERRDVIVNGEVVASLSHDDDGWQGMERVTAVCQAIEKILKK